MGNTYAKVGVTQVITVVLMEGKGGMKAESSPMWQCPIEKTKHFPKKVKKFLCLQSTEERKGENCVVQNFLPAENPIHRSP